MSIGQTLSAARNRPVSPSHKSPSRTRIRQTLIRTIERDDFSLCGGNFYARGHIRSLSRIIGIDPNPLIPEFDHASGVTPPSRPTAFYESETPSHRERRSAQLERRDGDRARPGRRLRRGPGDHAAPGASAGPPSRPSGSQVSNSVPAQPPLTEPDRPDRPRPGKQRRVTCRCRPAGELAQSTTTGGKQLFQGVMRAGHVKMCTAKQRIQLLIGNAGAVTPDRQRQGPGRSRSVRARLARASGRRTRPASSPCSVDAATRPARRRTSPAHRRECRRWHHVGHVRLADKPHHRHGHGLVPLTGRDPARQQGGHGGHLGRHPLVGRPPTTSELTSAVSFRVPACVVGRPAGPRESAWATG